MDADEKRKQIEIEILKVIKEKLESGEMDASRAQKIAQLVLRVLHPGLTLEEIYKAVPTLDDHFTELSAAVVPVMKEYEEKIEKIVREKMEQLIREGKFEDAIKVASEILQKKERNIGPK